MGTPDDRLKEGATNSAGVREACRKIERSVPGASSRYRGTMTVRPSLRSFTWLPRWLTCSSPSLARAATTAAPLTTGSAGLTQRAGRWR